MDEHERPNLANASTWGELISMARHQISLIERGNALVAKQVIKLAAQSIRGVLNGQLPDPEQRVYLEFLMHALDGIAATPGVDPRKALGVWTDSKRHSVPLNRDAMLFLAVGLALDKIRRISSTRSPVAAAIKATAKETRYKTPTVTKAWKSYGGEDAWMKAKEK